MGKRPDLVSGDDDANTDFLAEERALADKTPAKPEPDDGADAGATSQDDDSAAVAAELDGDDGQAAKGRKQGGRQDMVPHQALHAERVRREKAEETARQKEQEWAAKEARLDERLRLLGEAFAPPEAAPDAPPDPKQDIFGFAEWQSRKMAEMEQRLGQYGQQTQQQREAAERERQQADAERQFQTYLNTDERSFKADKPDFDDAITFLHKSRMEELQAIGYDQQTAAQMVTADARAIALNAIQTGRRPAEAFYNVAVLRGHKAGAGGGAANGEGADKVRRLSEAQDASQSLSRGGSAPGGNGVLTLESIDRMTDDEFQDLIRTKNAKNPEGFTEFMRKMEERAATKRRA